MGDPAAAALAVAEALPPLTSRYALTAAEIDSFRTLGVSSPCAPAHSHWLFACFWLTGFFQYAHVPRNTAAACGLFFVYLRMSIEMAIFSDFQ
jgi:hypothetical protein